MQRYWSNSRANRSFSFFGSFVVLLFIFFVLFFFLWRKPLHFKEALHIQEGDTLYGILQSQGVFTRLSTKLYARMHDLSPLPFALQVGNYPQIVWSVSKYDFFQWLAQWPVRDFQSVTLLEWWSSYDIDAYLFSRDLITAWSYVDYVRDPSVIATFVPDFPFLRDLGVSWLTRLEGLLYPETYHVSSGDDFLHDLVFVQLQTFQDRIWDPLLSDLSPGAFASWWQKLSPYDVLIFTSVVAKEESSHSQQADVAWVLLNRLEQGMRLDADITLCYGLEQGFDRCSPSVIVKHLADNTNVYNTRQRLSLPPTPIANITADDLSAVLRASRHSYLYYLHDNRGFLRMSKDLDAHNDNKRRYLQ